MRLARLTLRTVVMGAAVAVLTGCSSVEAGTPSSASSTNNPDAEQSTSTGNGAGPSTVGTGAPDVDKPLDPSDYRDKPCDLLSSSFLDELGFTESGEAALPEDDDSGATFGPTCSWDLSDSTDSIEVAIQSDRTGGLETLYGNHESGIFKYWETTTVLNYPAVFADSVDNRTDGECNMFVGVSDELVVAVISGPMEDIPKKACPRTKRIAGHVIEALEGSQ